MKTTVLLLAAATLAACDSSERQLKDLSWGEPFESDFDSALERTRWVLGKEFPKGFDPDLSKEEEGVFWTVWHYYPSTWYRETKRARAHVEIEDLGEGKLRIGVAVVQQINDNIDNPSIIEEARWVGTQRDFERSVLIEQRIRRDYLKVEPSAYFEEKHRSEPRKGLRPDIIDRSRDVDLEKIDDLDDPDRELPRATGGKSGD